MDREERLNRMNELINKEDFDYEDYKELDILLKDMEMEYERLKERFRKAAYGVK